MRTDIFETTNKEDVDLSSFELKDELNPRFWNGGKLDILARRKLLTIARDFISKFEIADFQIEDVIMTGSLANYNWDENHSDVDLHILVDFEDINDDTELVKEFFNAVKDRWNKTHTGIRIYGYPVEVYVQDVNEKHTSTGVYSVLYDEWITKPSKDNFNDTDVDEDNVQEMVAMFMNEIDDIEEQYLLAKDEIGDHDIQSLLDDAEQLNDMIKAVRKSDLGSSGNEISAGNLIFKSLRRNGYIEKLRDVKTKIYDLMNSL
jgi:hypothetical protein